ncbi:THO complex subunit 5 [Trifolium pratense]|uniref:THO complex subunit 5 n=1 Tax=Trifolium pratense TaxID=57577 RepID=A0A2K3P8L9_TRIPR|nr:THO complex subunit 5 [Trifolium pratense]
MSFMNLLLYMAPSALTLQANHSILTEEDRVKMEMDPAKAPVDFMTLQLHNLVYEKSHYLKAIKAHKVS